MSTPTAYRWRVMISSAMKDLGTERDAIARVITDAWLTPWYAENPPEEFRGVTGETLSFEMASHCDLYLLVIFARYGSRVFAGDSRSVTHQEYVKAREDNPRKVRVFIAADALEHADTPDLQAFVDEVKHFQTGYVPVVFHTLTELQDKLRTALASWREEGQGGRDAYMQTVRTEYQVFRNPVTGQEMDYGATVLLKLRAQTQGSRARRAEWGEADEPDTPEIGPLAGDPAMRTIFGDPAGRGRVARRRQRREVHTRESIGEAVKSPPQVATDLLGQYQHLVVLGDVGSGKTTLLKRLAHDAAEAYPTAQRPRIPIIVAAAKLGALAAALPEEPLAEVVGRLEEDDTRFEALRQTIRSTVSGALYRGEALLLVDGLDEAKASEQAHVFRLLGAIGANQALLASRPAAYGNQLPGWQIADLQQLGGDQRRELIVQVFRSEAGDEATPPAEDALTRDADELEAALVARQADLAAWAGNPLLLTLIAVQFVRDRRLPENRARIYAFAIEDLQRQRPPTARRYLTQEEMERLLRTLALRMTEALRRSTTVAAVRDSYLHAELAGMYDDMTLRTAVAREVLERSGVMQGDAVHGLREDMESQSQAISQHHDQDLYEFVHNSFREYLAACAMADVALNRRTQIARRHCLHQQWEEVLLLLVSRLDAAGQTKQADRLIRDLLAADHQEIAALGEPDQTHLALRIASRCALARGKLTSERLFAQIQRAWWEVWREEERRNRAMPEIAQVFNSQFVGFDLGLDPILPASLADSVEVVPSALGEGTPFLLDRLAPKRGFPSANWWLYGLIVPIAALALFYVVGQTTMNGYPSAGDGWPAWVRHALPYGILGALVLMSATRLLEHRVASSMTRGEMLTAALGEDNPARTQALGQMGERAPVAVLERALHDKNRDLRAAVARALGQLGERAPVDALLRALSDSDVDVRVAAATALGQLGKPVPNKALETLLQDADVAVRMAEVRALGQLGERAPVEILVHALDDANFSVRVAAVEALGQLGKRAPVDALVGALGDSIYWVYQAAASTLVQLSGQVPVDALVRALDNEDYTVRTAAVRVLGQFGERAPVELVARMLDDAHYSVRVAVVETLGQMGERAPRETLVRAQNDANAYVQLAASRALERLDGQAPVLTLDRTAEQSRIEALLLSLSDGDKDARVAAVTALGPLGDRVPLGAVLRALDDDEGEVRTAAARALGQMGGRDLPLDTVKMLAKKARHPPGWRDEGPLRALQWVTDWPVLIMAMAAQVVIIAPAFARNVPRPTVVQWLFGLTAWWQVLIVVAIYLVVNALLALMLADTVASVRRERAALLDLAEGIVRRQVADTQSATLATEGD